MAASPQPRKDDAIVVLSEAARQPAGQVGRLAADELPVTLRPVARLDRKSVV